MPLLDRHIRVINERAKPENKALSNEEVAKSCGMNRVTFWRLMKKPEAQILLRELTERYTALTRPRVIGALERAAVDGDVNAIRAYLQYTGDIGTGGHTNIVNVTQNNEERTLEERIDEVWERRKTVVAKDKG